MIETIIQRILEGQGLEIAFAGIITVFLALILISVCIALLPKILALFSGIFPEAQPPSSVSATSNEEEAIAAAIGYLHHTGKYKTR